MRSGKNRRRQRGGPSCRVAVVGLVCTLGLGVVGCSSDSDSSEGSASEGSASEEPSSEPSSPAESTPTAPPDPFADVADGRNVGSCRDARCEVLVNLGGRISLDRKFSVFSLQVVSIRRDQVTFATRTPAGTTRVNSVRFSSSLGCPGTVCTGTMLLSKGYPGYLNRVNIRVAAVEPGRAVVALSPRGAG